MNMAVMFAFFSFFPFFKEVKIGPKWDSVKEYKLNEGNQKEL